jgi:alcohol dehydrogenase
MGFETIAIARGEGKKADALELGAHHYVDSTAGDVSEALKSLGGVVAILATANNPQAIGQTVGGLQPLGQLMVIGVSAEPLPISPLQLITPALSVIGHPSGTARDVEETMAFAVLSGVRARIEEYPLAEAADAYAAMEHGRARYRGVLTM